MVQGPYERILDTLEDLDARLAGLQVGYTEANATAAQEHVDELGEFFDREPEAFVDLCESVDRLVETENSSHAANAAEHADALRQQVQAQADEES